ncbi:MAG: FtsX-like permease family protein [Halopseudomonas sp.]|uniref:ABC transporter permease n=1 Tax=Halopseudomonas sp. TaxID=2901191 RepID=UPI00300150E1
MSSFNTPALALRLLGREWRSGELRVLVLALLIAVTISTAISFFTNRIERSMTSRAAEFLGADMLVSSRSPLPELYAEQASQRGLQTSAQVGFSSVMATDAQMQLSSVKAVSAGYPQRGELRITDQPFGTERSTQDIPAPGEVWIEPRLLSQLQLQVGDSVDVGYASLRISALLTHEPDRAGDFYSLSPSVLMNLTDLPATRIVQPGSRVSFRLLVSGDEQSLQDYRDWLEPRLEVNQRVRSVADDNRQVGNALGRANQFLGLSSIAAVVLAGVAVALSAGRFAVRHFDASALLRCMGLSRRQVLRLFLCQLLLLGALATLAGLLLGWLVQWGLVALLHDLLPPDLPAPNLTPLWIGAATGFTALIGFALPPLLRLGRVAPLRVLRRDLAPMPSSSWLIYGLALCALCLLMWQFTGDLKLTLSMVFGGAVAALALGSLAWLLLRAFAGPLGRAGLAWRLGSGELLKQPVAAATQILAFGLIFMSMLVVIILRTELLTTWQNQLPPDSPNHFALNILPEQADAFADQLAEIGARSAPLYPVTPGRLVSINSQPVREQVTKDSQGERAINRDLSLTWSAELAADNQLREGQWWLSEATNDPQVSIEAELADSLGIKLGDQLDFVIAGQTLQGQVSSIREVAWDNFTPNFYMIFSPGSLDGLPATILTSFYLPSSERDALRRLNRAFPAMTLLEVEPVLEQIRSILAQVTLAVEYVLVFVLLAGLTVLFAALQATLDQRLYQGALLRTLGARKVLLRRANYLEFCLLGALAGLMAVAASELATWALYRFALDLVWQPHFWLWLAAPLGAAVLIGVAGALGTRAVVHQSPMRLINRSH